MLVPIHKFFGSLHVFLEQIHVALILFHYSSCADEAIDACALESLGFVEAFENPRDEQQDAYQQQIRVAFVWRPGFEEDDVDGHGDLSHRGEQVLAPQLVVFNTVGGDAVMSAKVQQQDGRPEHRRRCHGDEEAPC